MSAPDAYDVLGVAPDATPAQVRQAYHRAVRARVPSARARRLRGADARCALQVLRVHPDRPSQHADAARFERVQAAWEALRVRLVARAARAAA